MNEWKSGPEGKPCLQNESEKKERCVNGLPACFIERMVVGSVVSMTSAPIQHDFRNDIILHTVADLDREVTSLVDIADQSQPMATYPSSRKVILRHLLELSALYRCAGRSLCL